MSEGVCFATEVTEAVAAALYKQQYPRSGQWTPGKRNHPSIGRFYRAADVAIDAMLGHITPVYRKAVRSGALLSMLEGLVSPAEGRELGADVMIRGGPDGVCIEYGAWTPTEDAGRTPEHSITRATLRECFLAIEAEQIADALQAMVSSAGSDRPVARQSFTTDAAIEERP